MSKTCLGLLVLLAACTTAKDDELTAAANAPTKTTAPEPPKPPDERAFRKAESGIRVAKALRERWCSDSAGKCEEDQASCNRIHGQCTVAANYACVVQKTDTRAFAVNCYTTLTKCQVRLIDDPVYAQGGWECALFTVGG